MKQGTRFYLAGLIIAILFVIAAELIWLPAPLVLGGGMEWIELIDWLFYGLSLIPICWLIGSFLRLWNGKSSIALILIRLAVMVASIAAIAVNWFAGNRLELLLELVAASGALMFVDLIVSEAIMRRRMPWRSAALFVVAVLVLSALGVPTHTQVTYPAMTMNLNRYAHVENGAPGGLIDGVLVFDRPAVLADKLFGKLFPMYRFEPIPENEPPLSEAYAEVVAMKTNANEVAAAIAMEKAGVGKGAVPDGVRITAIVKGSPAESRLQAGDIIDGLDNRKITSVNDLILYLTEQVKPGDHVSVAIRRNGEELTVDMPAAASEDDPSRAVFGISVQTEVKLDTPLAVDFQHYMAHIGGPSHGAMLTLAIIDQLTPGGVTKGKHIAGTGTIEADGSVGMVGGVPQKAYAVARTHADVFFVPIKAETAAKEAAPDLNVVGVGTIDDILNWLQAN
ncbi:PDZ domain-containing protein [Paenibacillus sp. HB172176]|uniref:PDZ domain-containing protein n=1 Tax=Paenibacillus sp. HB172176 TaxID=2493690 RepID=UPI001438E2EE|nr:PDZ domain-containing protein [Paenibacillus sp. HB172176]